MTPTERIAYIKMLLTVTDSEDEEILITAAPTELAWLVEQVEMMRECLWCGKGKT